MPKQWTCSDCCFAPVKVEGKTTNYHICTKCGKPCDILQLKQILKELENYGFILEEVPKVYCEITGGRLSKLNYKAKTVLAEFYKRFWDKEIVKDDIKVMIGDTKSLEELKNELENYLGI